MGKKALQLASVASMIDQFNIPNIEILQSLGYKVDVVADFSNPGTITKERAENLKQRLSAMDVNVYDIAIPRTLNLLSISKAYKKVKSLLDEENYKIIHCHSPIGGAICRMAAIKTRKNGTKVIYTAHGFHFYKGAPKKNWMIYYPIEKFCSRFTDVLITITKEDYNCAKEKLFAKKSVYIPGGGVDLQKFQKFSFDRNEIRKSLGVDDSDLMLLSVGELNENKNHRTAILALSKIKNKRIKYYIAGKGTLEEELKSIIEDNHLYENVVLLGYRTDIAALLKAADVYILPSIREGLNVSLMEAMSSGLPCICGNIRGNTDLIEDSKGGYCFSPTNVNELVCCIERMNNFDDRIKMSEFNKNKIKGFDISVVKEKMYELYSEINCDVRK